MKKYYCSSDIGSVLVGNKEWTFAIPNIGGDGVTQVRIYKNNDEFNNDNALKRRNMKFISSIQGTFTIYSYDCVFHRLHKNEHIENELICTKLKGRYGVYNGEYTVAFVKWG